MRIGMQELVTELERQKQNSRDLVVSTSLLKATGSVNGVTLRVPTDAVKYLDLDLSEWAHQQVAQKCGIPQKYYDRVKEAGRFPLLADNINAWLPDKERRLVRVLDGKVRAILSDRYRVMDHYDLLFLALDCFKQHNAQIDRLDLSDTRLYVKAIMPDMQFVIPSKTPNDLMTPGLMLSNSEVGAGRFCVEPFVLRQVCTNGLVAPVSFSRVHLGDRMDLGEVFSDETKALEDKAIWAKCQDIIKAAFDPKMVRQWAEKLTGLTQIGVPSVTSAVDNVVGNFKLPEAERKALLDAFVSDDNKSAYGLVNAITSRAQQQPQYERQIEMERIAGKLAAMTEQEWTEQVLKVVDR